MSTFAHVSTPISEFVRGMAESIYDHDTVEVDGEGQEMRTVCQPHEDIAVALLARDILASPALCALVSPFIDLVKRDALHEIGPDGLAPFGYAYATCAWTDTNPFDGAVEDMHLSELLHRSVPHWSDARSWFNHYELSVRRNDDGDLLPWFDFH